MADLVRVTKRIKIGAGIANIYSRTPAVLATTAATLDERSGGRIILGLGTSGANVIEHWHGIKFEKPLQRTREYVEIIRMILHREKLIHQASFSILSVASSYALPLYGPIYRFISPP